MMIMKEPVLASDGFFYEKQAIEHWLAKHNNSPITGQKLKPQLYKCYELNHYIEHYLSINPDKRILQYIPIDISFGYADYIDKIHDLIKQGQYEGLLMYKRYDMRCMMDAFHDVRTMHFGFDENENEYIYNHFGQLLMNCKQYDVIKHVIDNCIDIECKYLNDDMKPIHYVCLYTTPELIRYMIEDKNINPECKGRLEMRPIHYALYNNNPDAPKLLVDIGVELECQDYNSTRPIHFACQYQSVDIIKYLVNKGVNLECEEKYGWRPIHIVCHYSTIDAIKYLVDRGVNLHSRTRLYMGKPREYLVHELLQFNDKLTDVQKIRMKWYIMDKMNSK